MRKFLPGSGNRNSSHTSVALAAFGLGILVTFFLTSRTLVMIEAILIVAIGLRCFCNN